MLKKRNVFFAGVLCCAMLSGCSLPGGAENERFAADVSLSEPEVTVATEHPQQISSGFIDAYDQPYVTLFQQADTASAVIARLYTGDEIEIYALEGEWGCVSAEGLQGYVRNQNIVFQKPESTTAAPPATTVAAVPATTASASAQQTQPPVTLTIVLKYDSQGIALPSSYPAYETYSSTRNGYCSANSCYMYKTASSSGPKREAEMLYKDDPVTVYGEYNGFYYLGTDSGDGYDWYGYVPKEYITLGDPPVSYRKNYLATQGEVDAGSCHIRSTPSKENDNNIVATVYSGFRFSITGFDGYWYHITYEGGSGYISYKMVKVW